ncbi:hypothetical protein OSC27_01985 [Microbacterium sp. STN6]|uniref:hypothetical protein n=1 Tax=Microbacterium sp. STN6 TaxID=2995588 RepID=UPI002260F31D|nr:hypothetical protein [Microbacterium sp. STN6]MCX7521042.1 hypothetical protein [Microbacterium sp. STN6]
MTYFDSGYLARGLTLVSSLRDHGDKAPVWVLCLDEAAKRYLDDLDDPSIHTLMAADIEAQEQRLAPLRATRSRMEYYFTCTPLLLKYVRGQLGDPGSVVVYLDADLYFFDDPALSLSELGSGSVGIIEHRYPERLARRLGKYGRFNVGWVAFRDDKNGRRCLDWWAESCLEWCSDTPEDGKYADQGYLDSFPGLVDNVVILPGAGQDLAPWNTRRYSFTAQLQGDTTRVYVDGDPLVFFHFHGVRRTRRWYVTSQLVYGSPMGSSLRNDVYQPYLRRLAAIEAGLRARRTVAMPIARRGTGLRGLLFGIQRNILDAASILSGNAIYLPSLRD